MNLGELPNGVKIEISKEDLLAFAHVLISQSRPQNEVEENPYILIDEVEKITGLARQTIYGRVSNGTIPFYKGENGKRLYFIKSEILEWMASGKKVNKVKEETEPYLKRNRRKRW